MGAKKLFLVDDDEIFKIAAEVLIKTHKLADEVVQMANGLEAYNALISLEHSPNDLPDVMLLDINMPVMNGWELLEELKQGPEIIRKQVQIHILTSSIAPEDLNLSKTYDFIDGYITKPLTNSDIDKVKSGL
ncbi:response regulator [Muricauda sp. SCSIO 64092]|uniref:response regulator n=1 Tax=Allomuricauda sp. SCSIO 64092 TaxID=2908842 RepID=UPI001FF5FD36|nr:response regulator [Muricauda sp. SCSIO 64092]UOY09012.1 response regulator [Muricauda sp. SCSIO 64092]